MSALYAASASKHYTSLSESDWTDKWIRPILTIYLAPPSSNALQHVRDRFLPYLSKQIPYALTCLLTVLSEMTDTDGPASSNQIESLQDAGNSLLTEITSQATSDHPQIFPSTKPTAPNPQRDALISLHATAVQLAAASDPNTTWQQWISEERLMRCLRSSDVSLAHQALRLVVSKPRSTVSVFSFLHSFHSF